jgi:selenocysteine lyase/cysteine desulfurase
VTSQLLSPPQTHALDHLRATEYRRLDQLGQTYLDYTGGGVYAESQLLEHLVLMSNNVFGNPHSGNPTSLAMTRLVEQTRAAVLDYFNASSDDYVAIFTPNATGALRLVGEAYPFDATGQYLLSVDNHNSVNGIREFARRRGAAVRYAPIAAPELRLVSPALVEALDAPVRGPKLFAYPAQSNLSGVQHSLEWLDVAHARGWDVLLDASAFVPTNRLDLTRHRPDFVSLSFYKMFGYPTGVGALIARREALGRLNRPWFSGGTVTFSSVRALDGGVRGHYLTPGAAAFEDGTVNYLSIPAVGTGLRWLSRIGLGLIHERVRSLTERLLRELPLLRHANGGPLVRVYGPADAEARGATIALNFVDPAGELWDCWQVERLANARNISLRAGCHCNPGAREVALGIDAAELSACFADADDLSYEAFLQRIQPSVQGVVRVSLGLVSNVADVSRFVEFAASFADRAAAP